jgi:hypothetical protein
MIDGAGLRITPERMSGAVFDATGIFTLHADYYCVMALTLLAIGKSPNTRSGGPPLMHMRERAGHLAIAASCTFAGSNVHQLGHHL